MSFSMGGRDSFSFIGFRLESSRCLPLSLRTELTKYRHIPRYLRHLEFELNSVDFKTILVRGGCRLQSKKGVVEHRRTLSKCLDVVVRPLPPSVLRALRGGPPELTQDRSYSARRLSSERVSYASRTRRKSAPDPPRSGWTCVESRRYAALISSKPAVGANSRMS